MLIPTLVLLSLPLAASAPAPCDPTLSALIRDVRMNSPSLAVSAQRSAAARARLAGAGVLADPMLSVRTRTDRGGSAWESADIEVMATQALPTRGRRRAETDQAGAEWRAAGAERDDAELRAIAEASKWYFELAHVDQLVALRRDELGSLRVFAQSARGRYASGAGRQQDALRAHAEITRGELGLVELEARRTQALAAINELRGRPSMDALQPAPLAAPTDPALDPASLLEQALIKAPMIGAAVAAQDAARAEEALARLASKPEISLGGFYEVMDAGRGAGSGARDQVGVIVGLSLPVRRRRTIALLDEAVAHRLEATWQWRATAAALERGIATLVARADEARHALDLGEGVLMAQSDESLRSALAGYSSGTATALEVFDSQRLLYDVRAATLRARADAAIAMSELRALVGGSLPGEAPCDVIEAEPTTTDEVTR